MAKKKAKTQSPMNCPECGCEQSYRAMVDGEAMRQCHCCGFKYPDPRKIKPVKTDEAEE